MNNRIQKALQQIAGTHFTFSTDQMKQRSQLIKSSAEKYQKNTLRTKKRNTIATISLAAVILMAFTYISILDPGLQSVLDAGLGNRTEKTIEPTKYLLSTPDGSSNDINVVSKWIYADQSRVAFQLSVDGLPIRDARSINDFICTPYITNNIGPKIQPVLANISYQPDNNKNTVELTYISYQNPNEQSWNDLSFTVNLTIGNCSEYWNHTESNLPQPTLVPYNSTYKMDFATPILAGTNRMINTTTQVNGIPMTLKSIFITPSYFSATVCYEIKEDESSAMNARRTIDRATLSLNDQPEITNSTSIPDEADSESSSTCEILGFATPPPQNNSKVSYKITIASVSMDVPFEDFMDTSKQQTIVEELSQKGVEASFDQQAAGNWVILKKPDEISEDSINAEILSIFRNTIKGPWEFSIKQ